jgi:hypothetical protein
MWPFILTRTLTLEKPIVASKSDVLSILHDPQRVLANNAMAVSVVQDASDPSWYTVTDRLPLIGLWTTHTTIRTRWTKTPDGCDVEVYANLWTRLDNQLRVRELESSEGTALYHEKVVVKVHARNPFTSLPSIFMIYQALFLFMPYIASTIVKGHRDFMDNLAAKLESMCFKQ